MVCSMRHRILLSVGLASAALLSCEGANLPAPDDPASITILQGDGLTGRVGEQLDLPLVIEVLDAGGGAVENATVVIELSAGSAEPDTARTDALGQITSEITLGSQVGETQGTARIIQPESNLAPAGFSFVAFAASANGLAMVSGDGQQGAAGTTLGAPLVVEVTDAFGNPIAGKRITWTVEGGGSVNEPSTITTADGRSSVLRTLGPASGSQTTTASSEGLAGSPVIFTHTATAGNPSNVRIVSGNEQVALPGTTLPQPLVVEVVDGGGNPVVGAAVTWVVTAGGGSLAPPTGTTDENGRASTTWTLGPGTGANTAQAVVSGVGEGTFTATASAGNPADIRIVSGNQQQGQAGTRLANPLVVVVVDDADNPVSGVTVTWRVESGAGSVTPRTSPTDGSGRSSTAWTLGARTGEQSVEASAPGAGTVRFEATSTAGSPSTLGIATQPPGNAEVGTTFSRQPVIQVRDAAGNPVAAAGVTVTAAIANGGGSLFGTTSRTTDANGQATFTDLGITGAIGMHRLIFAASGFTSVTSAPVTVRRAETTTRIVSDLPEPSQPGQGVQVVFEVVNPSGAPLSGTVRVTASGGQESCSADLSVGRCTITLNADGDRTLTASFQGGTLFESSSDTESHQVITPDQPPTAQNDSYGATAGVPLTVAAGQGVLANDSDPDGDSMTASLVSGPSSGTLTFNSDGSFVYTPSASFFGSISFTYQVSAGGQTDTATVTIIVT
jgi:Bacterial Ig domain/Carboxypeptidase regulatory-like domain/Bacterial Ig-like domain (group 1)